MKEFSAAARQEAEGYLGKYPKKEAALLPILHLAQKDFGFIDDEAELAVADLMGISPISVREASRFYFMYHHHPIGKFHLQVCQNITCTIMGAETILSHLKDKLGIEAEQRTEDELFSIERVECIACCDVGPAMFVNEDLVTNLTAEKVDAVLDKCREGQELGDLVTSAVRRIKEAPVTQAAPPPPAETPKTEAPEPPQEEPKADEKKEKPDASADKETE
ncbi:NAD(P)H-dependent oxidoreductase subunit E [bacterium]|nr:NAD(P)H-dependent oxidoreductase subunit E [bacterium]